MGVESKIPPPRDRGQGFITQGEAAGVRGRPGRDQEHQAEVDATCFHKPSPYPQERTDAPIKMHKQKRRRGGGEKNSASRFGRDKGLG